jgi:ferrochelatase
VVQRVKGADSKRAAKRIAGVVWILVGAFLGLRGVLMALEAETWWGLALAVVLGAFLGTGKGVFVLSKAARRNIARIDALAHPRPWNAFAGRFYFLILLMMGLGFSLRWMAGRGWLPYPLVGAIYVGIGAGLLASSIPYFKKPKPPLPTRTDLPPTIPTPPIGVLLSNLGTPDAPTPRAVRRYLREFLGDPRVIEFPSWLWVVILNGIILPIRSRRSARAYDSVWTESGSPLLRYTVDTASLLQDRLGETHLVTVGMRYGNPGLPAALDVLHAAGCERIIVLPLYPQYSNTTTGTTQAAVAELAGRRRNQPALSFVPPYPDHPSYIAALADRIRTTAGSTPPDLYVFSFHGLPEAYVARGDVYVVQCTRTAWALARELNLPRDRWEMVFQSRFGPQPWLQPYLDEYVCARALDHPRILVATPGFATDCLETLEEVDIRLREQFLEAGGKELLVVPALNDHPKWISALEDLVRRS